VGRLEAVCIAAVRGVPKAPVASARLVAGRGLDGDAHATGGDRQVSLLPAESADRVRGQLPDLAVGAFGENLLTRGLDLAALRPGDRLAVGDAAVLEVTVLGKVCHHACAIRDATGDCIMPREGVFARVLRDGVVRPGDAIAPLPPDAVP
jgi:molybdopterin adenylyltransferase